MADRGPHLHRRTFAAERHARPERQHAADEFDRKHRRAHRDNVAADNLFHALHAATRGFRCIASDEPMCQECRNGGEQVPAQASQSPVNHAPRRACLRGNAPRRRARDEMRCRPARQARRPRGPRPRARAIAHGPPRSSPAADPAYLRTLREIATKPHRTCGLATCLPHSPRLGLSFAKRPKRRRIATQSPATRFWLGVLVLHS